MPRMKLKQAATESGRCGGSGDQTDRLDSWEAAFTRQEPISSGDEGREHFL